jgi:hypothetical protein
MTRKCHVRFGGGFEEKCFGKQSNSPHSYPTTLPIGNPRVNILAPGGIVGSYLRVRVSCTVPNYMGSLVPGLPPHWDVNGEATFRQEGW